MKKTALLLITANCLALNANASTISMGEVDFEVHFEGGSFELEAKQIGAGAGGTNIVTEADQVTVAVPNSRAQVAPANSSLIGVTSGQTFWTLPQSQISGVPFIGLASEELTAADWTGGITIEFIGLQSAPAGGEFSMWNTDSGGTNTWFFSSADEAGTTNGDNTLVSNFSHDHFNWSFSQPGTYRVQIGLSGNNTASGAVTGGGTMVFNVIPEPSSTLLVGLGLALGFVRRR